MVYPTLTSCGITWRLQTITHKLLTLTKVNNCMLHPTKSSTCPCASLVFSTSSTCPCASLVLSTTKAKYRGLAWCAVLRGFLRGSPSITSLWRGTLSSRFSWENCCYSWFISSQVASSGDRCCHWTKALETNFFPFFTQQYFRILRDWIMGPPSSENGGIVGVVLVGSPTFRLSSETWKSRCTLDSMDSARQYATGPTLASIWNGPKYVLASF